MPRGYPLRLLPTQEEMMSTWKGDVTKPLVSICCITYNHESYIENTLEGFLIQATDFPFEILIHDDASTDQTADIIRQYEAKYPQLIKPIYQTENQYSQGKRITLFLINNAIGDYLAFCEGDDFWTDPEKLQIQIEKMREHSECHLSFHPTKILNDQTMTDTVTFRHAEHDKIFSVQEIIQGDGGFCPTASLIIKKEALQNLPAFFAHAPVGDYFLQIFGSLNGGALYIDKTMSAYRIHPNGVWTSTAANQALKIKFTFRFAETLQKMDAFFNFRYHEEISVVKNNQILNLSEGVSWLEIQLQNHQDSLKITEEAKDWLEGQVQAQAEELRNKDVWIKELQQGKDWLEGQVQAQAEELRNKDVWIKELQQGKDWLEGQVQAQAEELSKIKKSFLYKFIK
jgi:glycosyltransferase involved in cell wall biosynthesis